MIIGYARVSTTEQNLGLDHDDLKPAFDASVDPTEARLRNDQAQQRRGPSER
jgi:DNA invertase Pin-like site-specific DNA recombinase